MQSTFSLVNLPDRLSKYVSTLLGRHRFRKCVDTTSSIAKVFDPYNRLSSSVRSVYLFTSILT